LNEPRSERKVSGGGHIDPTAPAVDSTQLRACRHNGDRYERDEEEAAVNPSTLNFVGVNTATPQAQLHVQGTQAP
jgi:hypothetical protein